MAVYKFRASCREDMDQIWELLQKQHPKLIGSISTKQEELSQIESIVRTTLGEDEIRAQMREVNNCEVMLDTLMVVDRYPDVRHE